MSKKRILFIIQSYPSEESANVYCDEKIMKDLISRGDYEIHCLSYQYNKQPLEDNINGILVHRFRKSILWDVYTWARHHSDRRISKLIFVCKKIDLRIRELIFIPIYPFNDPIDCWQYSKAAIKLHRKSNFDVVFAEHLGISNIYAAKCLKKFDPRIKSIAVFWDPMYGKNGAKYLPTFYTEFKALKAQERLVSNLDVIVQMDSVETYMREKQDIINFFDKIHFFSIPGIVKSDNQVNNVKQLPYFENNMINVLYTGLLTSDRNPIPVLELLEKTQLAERLNFVFFTSGIGLDVLRRFKEKSSLSINVSGYVKRDELVLFMEHADVLMNISGEQINMVPSKIFDYMSSGKPIISFFHGNDASTKYLKKYPKSCLVDLDLDNKNNINSIEAFLGSIDGTVDFDYLLETFPYNTPSIYTQLIESLIEI